MAQDTGEFLKLAGKEIIELKILIGKLYRLAIHHDEYPSDLEILAEAKQVAIFTEEKR